jgi:outer membrane protein OmpA-like peptidoglycan-associated protein
MSSLSPSKGIHAGNPSQPGINIEALKRDIYKSILDTLRKTNPTTIISAGYLQFSIFFDVNKFNIKEEEMKKVASIAEYMKNDKSLRIKVVGNADQSGSDEYNDYLSKKRAEEVYNTLINKYSIENNRLSLDSKGKRDPFSKEHFSVNRRVDFIKE